MGDILKTDIRYGEEFPRTRLLWAWRMLALLAIFATCALRPGPANSDATGEYQIEAAFLYNFAGFVEWPAGEFSSSADPITIGILGDDPFGSNVDQAVRDKVVGGRKLTVRRYKDIREVSGCQLLFISSSEEGHLSHVLDRLKGRGILTVSDIEDFAQSGGMIELTMVGRKIGFKINVGAAKRARLNVSSKLLKLAKVVDN